MSLGKVPQLEVDQACEEREAALDRKKTERKNWARNKKWALSQDVPKFTLSQDVPKFALS